MLYSINLKYLLLPITLVFLHLVLLRGFGFEFTVTFFILLIIAVNYLQIGFEVPRINIFILSLLIFLPFINFSLNGAIEFFKTYLLYTYFLLLLFLFISYPLKKDVSVDKVNTVLKYVQIFIVLYAAFQYGLMEYLHIPVLYVPWGEAQFFGQYDYELYSRFNNLRATAFYLEPSVLGLLLACIFWCIKILDQKITYTNFILTFAGLIVAKSLGGWVIFLSVIGYWLYSLAHYRFLKLFLLILFLILFPFVIPQAPRFSELDSDSSSLYWRLIAPVIILSDLIPAHISGLPFGSVYDVVSSYGLMNGDKTGQSIDNGHLLLFYYFGLLSLFLYIGLTLIFFSSNYVVRSYLVFWFFAYFFSGAVFNVEYAFLMFYLPLIIIKLTSNNNERYFN